MSTQPANSAVANNYHPLPVELARGEGSWVWDTSGRAHLDMLAGYSALNFGHRHPRLIDVAHRQLDAITLTSRAFGNDQLGGFCSALAELCGKEMVLPMNTGAEAVETGIKMARRWGYKVKGVPEGKAEIIVCAQNFHGRTTTIIGFSSDPDCRDGFGPFPDGFRAVPFGDIGALCAAINDRTVAFLVEPIQGEAGVIIPPHGYLAAAREVCTAAGILMIADEVQSGMGRTGRTFACEHEGVVPDAYLLGKALGGGIVPVSAVVADEDVLGVFTPGSHGSTFGGNPLACAIGREVVAMMATGEHQARAAALEPVLHEGLDALGGLGVVGSRVRGLWAGVDVAAEVGSGRRVCELLLGHGVLAKDTHGSTLRLAPPLVITEDELRWGLEQLGAALADALRHPVAA